MNLAHKGRAADIQLIKTAVDEDSLVVEARADGSVGYEYMAIFKGFEK
jgi:hypothetical protein